MLLNLALSRYLQCRTVTEKTHFKDNIRYILSCERAKAEYVCMGYTFKTIDITLYFKQAEINGWNVLNLPLWILIKH